MYREALHDALRDLGWSLFTELGVPGVVRRHQHVAIDPEPIIVAIPSLFDLDPRLRDQVYGWSRAHSDRISVSRLQGLVRDLPDTARVRFQAFASTLRAHGKVRWPAEGAEPWTRIPDIRAPRLPMERPALLRFRLRALCGVGARADVLTELLARSATWTTASDLAHEGYSKRAVAGILSELAAAGLARQVAEGNTLTFQLALSGPLADVVVARDLAFPPWRRIMEIVLLFLDLAGLEQANAPVRRVEASKRREALQKLSGQIGLDPLPETRGNPDAWEVLMSWATRHAVELAESTSPGLGMRR